MTGKRFTTVLDPNDKRATVLTCMDVSPALQTLLKTTYRTAYVVRNAGGVASKDAIRSVLLTIRLLGSKHLWIVGHTGCIGAHTQDDQATREYLSGKCGKDALFPLHFHGFGNCEEHVSRQVDRVITHPWFPSSVHVEGILIDDRTAVLRTVCAVPGKCAE